MTHADARQLTVNQSGIDEGYLDSKTQAEVRRT